MAYIKYHNVLYPMLIGLMFLPISYTFFPDVFLVYAVALFAVGGGSALVYVVLWRTRN
jgi:hypothetical protein